MKKVVALLIITLMIFGTFAAKTKGYTSLVIDAKDLSLKRSMSPKILNESGLEIYGTILNEKDLEKVMEIGVVSYIDSIENAKKHLKTRIGANPMVVKAKGVIGTTASNIVIKNTDASKILKINRKDKFLDTFNVIILVNPEN